MKRTTEPAPAGDRRRWASTRLVKWAVFMAAMLVIQWPQALPVILLALYWILLAMLFRSRDAAAWTQAPLFLRGRWLWCLVCLLLLAQGVWLTVAYDDLVRSEMRQAGASAAPSAPRVLPSTPTPVRRN